MRLSLPPLATLLLAAAVLLLYWPATGFELVNYDDEQYVRDNPAVRAGFTADGLRQAAASTTNAMYIPLTWISLAADVELWGGSPAAFHRTNVILFALSAALLLLLLHRATGALWPSAAAAALFALHPLRVESVAWVVERKDVLCLLFLLLALAAWMRHVRTGAPGPYLASLLLFACALLAKPVAVTFPLLLLALDRWPFARGGGSPRAWIPLAREKIPFLALGMAASLLTLHLHRLAAPPWVTGGDPWGRLQLALLSPWKYLAKTLWPAGLALRHITSAPPADWRLPAAAAALLLATFAAFRLRRRAPFLLSGWLWYLAALLPMVGILQAADRHTLLPHIGLAVAVSWGAAAAWPRRPVPRAAAAALAAAVLLSLAAASARQLRFWRDTGTLMGRALGFSSFPGYHNNLGAFLLEGRAPQEAAVHLRLAVEGAPEVAIYRKNLGLALLEAGRAEEALPHLREALRLDPAETDHLLSLSAALLEAGGEAEALALLEGMCGAGSPASRLPACLLLRGRALALLGRTGEAERALGEALEADPSDALASLELAELLWREGQEERARRRWKEVAEGAPPGKAEGLFSLGRLAEAEGDAGRAASLYREAASAPALDEWFPGFLRRVEGR